MADRHTISLVIATISRPTLARSLRSLVGQDWRPGDEVLVVGDGVQPVARELCEQFARLISLRYLENPGPRGFWGHHARNWVLDTRQARGSYLMALDDDDEYTPGAIASARRAFDLLPVAHPHIFRMSGHPSCELLWSEPAVRVGNFGTPCIACPNDPNKLGRYALTYAGDFEFARTTLAHYPGGWPVWREEVVCAVRPTQQRG
ncbi:glycosyltransferase family A protein [Gemmata sp. JC717]|uniref:glycosyltransferase family A protein n=1 Tax=Gemmata algarum TaxID=2975278 RepID=UPI0021BAB310|nr:glycosyltransferase family A protein [Gemmata algarum]MDY3555297.1 glycosyltransferase family A protein [Gemmata algarum]